MLLNAIRVHGLHPADAEHLETKGNWVHLPVVPQGHLIADCLTLVRAALVPEERMDLLDALGWTTEDSAPQPEAPEQINALCPGATRHLVRQSTGNTVLRISLQARPDPVLYGLLKNQATRHPDLVSALATGAPLSLQVGWMFTRDRTTALVSVDRLSVGEVSVPLHSERNHWTHEFLALFGRRLGRLRWDISLSDLSSQLLEAQLSSDPSRRGAFERVVATLSAPPFRYSSLELVRHRDSVIPCFGADLTPITCFGPRALDALRLVCFAILEAPDVAIITGRHRLPTQWREWLERCLNGADATLEQVLLIPETSS